MQIIVVENKNCRCVCNKCLLLAKRNRISLLTMSSSVFCNKGALNIFGLEHGIWYIWNMASGVLESVFLILLFDVILWQCVSGACHALVI